MLYSLFREFGIDFDGYIASCFYIGIATDTGFYAFPNTRPETLEIFDKFPISTNTKQQSSGRMVLTWRSRICEGKL